jgi:hypothetical protein
MYRILKIFFQFIVNVTHISVMLHLIILISKFNFHLMSKYNYFNRISKTEKEREKKDIFYVII